MQETKVFIPKYNASPVHNGCRSYKKCVLKIDHGTVSHRLWRHLLNSCSATQAANRLDVKQSSLHLLALIPRGFEMPLFWLSSIREMLGHFRELQAFETHPPNIKHPYSMVLVICGFIPYFLHLFTMVSMGCI